MACGDTSQRLNGGLHIFIESFDNATWVILLIVLAVLIPGNWTIFSINVLNNTRGSVKLWITVHIIFATYQNLVKQSTPFATKLFIRQSLKVLAAGTILCTLVLSNAYKNENMYELMNPPKFRPFETFKQILVTN